MAHALTLRLCSPREGFRPYLTGRAASSKDKWVAAGIRTDYEADKSWRLHSLMDTVADTIPDPGALHCGRTAFAYRWAELSLLRSDTAAVGAIRHEVSGCSACAGMPTGRSPPGSSAATWGSTISRPTCRRWSITGRGLSNGGFRMQAGAGSRSPNGVRDGICSHFVSCASRFHEDAMFAWVPTVPSVSRQAIFAGTPPL